METLPPASFIGSCGVRLAVVAALAIALSSCGGSTLPTEVQLPGGGSGPIVVPPTPLNVTMLGFVGGDVGDGAANPSTAGRGRQASLAQTVGGQVVAGANGTDLKDLAWGNLFSQGLSTSSFPTGTQTQIRFYAEGGNAPLAVISSVPATGLFESVVNATSLRTGSRMEIELSVNGNASRIKLPILTLRDQDRLGFNLIRRQNGSMVAELFVDSVVNATGAAGSDGLSDNGLRIVVDNGSDLTGDGKPTAAARLDSADGLSFLDLNLDGRFGDPEFDSITFIDANDSGFADTPLVLATEAQRVAMNNPETASFFFDPELDGIRAPLADRKVSEGTEADLLGAFDVALTPESLRANGINAATLRIQARTSAAGFPLNAPVRFELTRTGGTLLAENGEAKFQSSGATFAARVLSPADPEVRLLSDGSFLISESVLMPLIDPSTIDEEHPASLTVTVGTGERLAGSPDITVTKSIGLLPSDAPILTSVLVAGQYDVSGVSGGLEAVSRAAVLTWGARVRVIGQNFATTVAGNSVAVGGTPVSGLTVNETGTELEFDVPEGAATGPVSVIVGGLGGITSQNLAIAGEPLTVRQAHPAGGQVPANTGFSLVFSRPLASSSVGGGSVFVRQTGGASLGWTASLDGDRTVVISQGEGAPMVDAGSYEVVVTSGLEVAGTEPLVRFDPVINVPLGEAGESAVVVSVTAIPADTTAPTVESTIPVDQSVAVDPVAAVTITFSEAVQPESVAAAAGSGGIRILNADTESSVPFDWNLSENGRVMTLVPSGGMLPGSAQIQVAIDGETPKIRDAARNPLADASFSFTTSAGVSGFTPRSGPVGSKVLVEGTGFEGAGTVSVQLGSTAISQIEIINDSAIEFTVPAGSTGGTVTVTADGVARTAGQPFTVTLNLQRVNLPGLAGSRPIGVAISADDTRVFLSNQGTGNVSVYDLNEMAVVDSDGTAANGQTRIQLGSVPSEAILTRDGKKLLSLDYGTPETPGDSFFVVDASKSTGEPSGESYAVEATVQVGSRPTRIATSPDGRRWYVTNFLSSSLSIISAEPPYQVVATVPTGEGPNGVGVSPDGTRCYVCNFMEGTLTILDTSGNEVVGTVPVGLGPSRARVSPNGRWVLVSCNEDSTLHVVDAIEKRNVLKITGPAGPSAMAFSRDGDQVFLCSRVLDVVAVYDFSEVDGKPVLSQPTFIQTGRVPSGIAVTGDGSRIVVAHEADGNAGVVWLKPPVQSVVDIQFPNGEQTRSADEGQELRVLGAGFSPVLSENRVLFGTVEALPNVQGSSKGTLSVTVPAGAQSGPMTVVINGVVSNAIDFLVTPSVLRVTRILPANGAVGISPSTEIVCRCNEPVRGGQGDWVVERMLDTFTNGERDVDPTPIAGTVRARDFGYEMVFTPDAPLPELPNSNNLYRVTIRQTLDDRAGNTLQRDVVSFFQLADTRGPTLLRAVLIDVDNNGVDPLDILSLVFDEEVSSRGTLPAPVGGLLGFNDTSTLGTDATIQFPALALIERTSPVSQLDPFSRTMMVRLGTSPSLLVPGLRTAVTGLTNLEGDLALRDAAGNTGLLLVSPAVDVEFFVGEVPAPRALAAVLSSDPNFNGIGEAGENIGIYCNTPLTQTGTIDPTVFTLAGTGATLGTGATAAVNTANHRVITITLGTGANMDFNDPNLRISSLSALTQLVSFADVPLAAWDGASISYSIGTPPNGPLIDTSVATPVVYDDTDGNGLDAGDIIRVQFDRPMVVGNAPAALCFRLPVAGNSFGAGALVRNSQDNSLDAFTRARTVEIVLGPNANILPQGTGTATATSFGSSSTLEVSSTIPVWAVADEFGISARPDPSGIVFDIGSSDVTAPVLHEAVFVDANSNGTAESGDGIALVFNESVRRNGVTVAAFTVEEGATTGLTFGTGATIARGQARSVGGQVVAENTLVITLGTGANVPLVVGTRIVVNSGNPVADSSGNTLAALSSTPLRFTLPPDAVMVSAHAVDETGDGIGSGDSIYVKFDQPMSFPGGAPDPSTVFELLTQGDSFGAGASLEFAVVNQAMISLGITNFGIGTTDRSAVRVVLGTNARISKVGGVAINPQPLAAPGTPSAIAMRSRTALAFTTSQLVSALDDSGRTGVTLAFNQVTLQYSASGGSRAVNFTLGGGASEFNGSVAHYQALVSAFNGAFVTDGLRLRAAAMPGLSGLAVFDNGEGLLGSGGGIVAAGDVVNGQFGSYVPGMSNQLSNAVGIAPSGRSDIGGQASTVAPVIVSAVLDDQVPGSIAVTFSKPVEFPVSQAASAVFMLPVTGDRFGTGATVNQTSATVLTISLTSDRVITAPGVFAAAVTTAGSPSGLRVRPTVTSLVLSDTAGNAPAVVPLDITGGTINPPPVLFSVAGFQTGNPQFIETGSTARVLAFDLVAGTGSGPFLVNSLSVAVTSSAANPASVVLRTLLVDDANGNRQFDSGESILAASPVTTGSVTFMDPIGTREVTNTAPVSLLLLAETVPDPTNAGKTVTFTLDAVSAETTTQVPVTTVSGLPLSGGTRTIQSTQPASPVNGALATLDGQPVEVPGAGRTNHAAASVMRRHSVWMRIEASELAAALSADGNGRLTGVGIDLNGNRTADIMVNTDVNNQFSGGVNTPAELAALVAAANAAIAVAPRTQDTEFILRDLRAEAGPGGALLFVHEVRGFDQWNNSTGGFYGGQNGGLMFGGSVLGDTENPIGRDSQSQWPGPRGFVFGGRDAAGGLKNDTLVLSENDGGSGAVTTIPVDTSSIWSAREGHMAVAAYEDVFLFGGKAGTTVFNDLWQLVPVRDAQTYGPESSGNQEMPGLLAWREISATGAPSRHGAVMVYIHDSPLVKRSLVVIGGSANPDGSAPSNQVWAFSLDTRAWQQLTVTGTLQARFGAAGVNLAGNRLMLYGGRSGTTPSTTLTSVQILDFGQTSGVAVTTPTVLGTPWAGGFGAAAIEAMFGSAMLVMGGSDSTNAIAPGFGALAMMEAPDRIRWIPFSNFGFDIFQTPSRTGAKLVGANDLWLTFGADSTGVTSSIVPVNVEFIGGDGVWDSEDGEAFPLVAYQHPSSGGTVGSDAGDRIVTVFPVPTNLLGLVPTQPISLTDLSRYVRLRTDSQDSETAQTVAFPAGTTATVESRLFTADTLVITLGGPVAELASTILWLDFSGNGAVPEDERIRSLGANAGFAYTGDLPIVGSADHNVTWIWTGAAGSDWFDRDNWVVGSGAVSNAPGIGDFVLIPAGTPPCVIPRDLFPPAVTGGPVMDVGLSASAGQLVVHGGTLLSGTRLTVGSGPLGVTGLVQCYGRIAFAGTGDALLEISGGSSPFPPLWLSLGTNHYSDVLVTGPHPQLIAEGLIRIDGDFDASGKTVAPFSDEGAGFLFTGPGDSQVFAQSFYGREIIVGKDSQTSVVSLAAVGGDLEFGGVFLESGIVDTGNNSLRLYDYIEAQPGAKLTSGSEGNVTLTGINSELWLADTEISRLVLEGPSRTWVPDPSFTGGLPTALDTDWGTYSSGFVGAFNGRTGVLDTCVEVTAQTQAVLKLNMFGVTNDHDGGGMFTLSAWVYIPPQANVYGTISMGGKGSIQDLGSGQSKPFQFDATHGGTWHRIWLDASGWVANMPILEIAISIDNGIGVRIDDVSIMTRFDALGGLSATSLLELEHANLHIEARPGQTWSVGQDLIFNRSRILAVGDGTLEFGQHHTIPATSELALHGTVYTFGGQSHSMVLRLPGVTPSLTVNGAISAANATIATATASGQVMLNGGSNAHLADTRFMDHNLTLNPVQGLAPQYLRMSWPEFRGVPAFGSVQNNSARTFLSFLEPAPSADQVNAVNIWNAIFLEPAQPPTIIGTIKSVESAATSDALPWLLFEVPTGSAGAEGNLIGPAAEYDAATPTAPGAQTGSIQWPSDTTVNYAPANSVERFITAGSANQVIGSLRFMASSAATIMNMSVMLEANFDLRNTSLASNFRFTMADGTLIQSVTLPSAGEAWLDLMSHNLPPLVPTEIQIRADLGSSLPLGAHVSATLMYVSGDGVFEHFAPVGGGSYPQSNALPYFFEHPYAMDQVRLGSLTVGTPLTPVIYHVSLESNGQNILDNSPVSITGRNLTRYDTFAIAQLSDGHTVTFADAWVTGAGTEVIGARVSGFATSQTLDGIASFTLTPGFPPVAPRTFTFTNAYYKGGS